MNPQDEQEVEENSSYASVIPDKFGKAAEQADEERGEDVEIDEEDADIIELEDGSAVVVTGTEKPDSENTFYTNLAEKVLDTGAMNVLGGELCELIKRDKESREERDKQYAEGIKRTGLGGESPGGADFEGASRAVHPILAEGCVDFASRAIKEIFPAKGPVRTNVLVAKDDEAIAKANRKEKYLNWQLMYQVPEYRDESEQMLTQMPLGGSQFKKWWFDAAAKRPMCEFVPVDDVYLPYAATSFYTARRATIYQRIVRSVFQARVNSGFYTITNSAQEADPGSLDAEQSASSEASERIEGKEEQTYDDDGLRGIFECYVYLDLPDDPKSEEGKELPYIVHLDAATETVLAVYRNWEEDDDLHLKLDWVVEYKFIPWRGAYGIGLLHLIGSLSAALTGAVRSLLDSALINNFPGLLKLKGSGINAQTTTVDACTITDIESNGASDDIRKLIMAAPYNPPSPVLMTLVQMLTDYAKGVVNTAEERIADAGANMPVGTALALIEQGSITFSAIHSRLHASQAVELRILCRLNASYVNEDAQRKQFGVVLVTCKDFEKTDDIIPVSDPNIFSDAQRFAQLQSVMQLAEKYPQFYDMEELNAIALELLKFPNAERVLQKSPTPFHANAVAENVACASGATLLAAPDDEHLAHLVTHLQFATAPITGALLPPTGLTGMGEHVRQHLLFYYAHTARDVAQEEAHSDLTKLITDGDNHTQVDAALATASEQIITQMTTSLQTVTKMYSTFQQKLQQAQQAQQSQRMAMDPTMAQVQAALKETERRAARDAEDTKLAAAKFQDQQMVEHQSLIAEIVKTQDTFKAELLTLITPMLGPQLALAQLAQQPDATQQALPPHPAAPPMPAALPAAQPPTPMPPPQGAQLTAGV